MREQLSQDSDSVIVAADVKKAQSGGPDADVSKELGSDIRRLGKGAAVALVGRVGGRALLLINQVILARLLGPDTFGLYALGWTMLQMAGTIVPLGVPQAVVRYGSPAWGKDNGYLRVVLQRSLFFAGLLGLVVGGALFGSAEWLANVIFQKPDLLPVLKGFALAVVLIVLVRVMAAATRISQRMQFSALIEDLLQPAIQLLLVAVLVMGLGWGLRGAVLSAVVGFVGAVGVGMLLLWHLFGRALRHVSPASFSLRELLAFSLPTSMAGIFTMLTLRVDRLLVGYFLPASDVGIYQAATQAAMLSVMILGAFNAIFSPMIARLYHQNQQQRLNELFKVSTKWGLYASLPLFLVLLVVPHEVITIVFGKDYVTGAVPMLIMAGGQLFNAATGAVGMLLIMSGHHKRWFVLSGVSFAANILLCMTLIPPLGITGAALAAAVSIVLLFGWGLIEVRRLLGFWPYDRRYIKVLLAALGSLTVLIGFRAGFEESLQGFAELVGITLAGVSIFSILVLLKPDVEDRELLRALLARIKRYVGNYG